MREIGRGSRERDDWVDIMHQARAVEICPSVAHGTASKILKDVGLKQWASSRKSVTVFEGHRVN